MKSLVLIRVRRLVAAVGLGAALAVAVVGSVFAADYSSEVSTAGGTLVADAALTIAAVVVIGLGVIALFVGMRIAFRAFRRAGG